MKSIRRIQRPWIIGQTFLAMVPYSSLPLFDSPWEHNPKSRNKRATITNYRPMQMHFSRASRGNGRRLVSVFTLAAEAVEVRESFDFW
jgi:hypothetical protein